MVETGPRTLAMRATDQRDRVLHVVQVVPLAANTVVYAANLVQRLGALLATGNRFDDMRLQSKLKQALACGLLIGALVACTTGRDVPYKELIPKDASGLEEPEGVPWKQVGFTIKRAYPAFAFDSAAINSWAESGWTKCSATQPWVSFVDGTQVPQQLVHQNIQMLRRRDSAILLIGRYVSDTPSRVASGAAPATDSQTGVLLFYSSLPISEIDVMANGHGLKCGAT